MRKVPTNTKRNILRFLRSYENVSTRDIFARIKDRGYKWPYKSVQEKHVVELLEDMGLWRRDTDSFPWHAWTIDPPTQQERAARFLKWAKDNKRCEVSYDCCGEHSARTEGFNEATDDIIERLKIDFPEIFA